MTSQLTPWVLITSSNNLKHNEKIIKLTAISACICYFAYFSICERTIVDINFIDEPSERFGEDWYSTWLSDVGTSEPWICVPIRNECTPWNAISRIYLTKLFNCFTTNHSKKLLLKMLASRWHQVVKNIVWKMNIRGIGMGERVFLSWERERRLEKNWRPNPFFILEGGSTF